MESIGYIFLASEETCRNKYHICRDHFLAAFDRNHVKSSGIFVFYTFQFDDLGFADISFFIFDKLGNGCLIDSRVMTQYCNGLFLAVIGFQNLRPLRPRVGRCSCYRRLRHHLKLCHGFCPKTNGSSHTVISGITTADDQNMFALCKLIWEFCKIGIQKAFCYLFQEIHCKVDSFCISSRNLDISWMGSSAAEKDTVVIFQKLLCCNVHPNIDIGDKFHAFLFHQFQSAVDDFFLKFHIRDTVTEKSSDTVVSLKYGYAVSAAVQLLCCCQSGRSASDDCNCLSSTDRWNLWFYPAFCVSGFNDGFLIFFCADRFSVQIAGTCSLTKRRTHSGCKLRKTVGLVQTKECLFPVSCVYKIVCLRNQVVKRTAGSHSADHHTCLAEGNAAGHATCSLKFLFFFI